LECSDIIIMRGVENETRIVSSAEGGARACIRLQSALVHHIRREAFQGCEERWQIGKELQSANLLPIADGHYRVTLSLQPRRRKVRKIKDLEGSIAG
jgi:hypothetical protein